MCAIVGALLKDITTKDRADRVRHLLAFIMSCSLERGRDGAGMALNTLHNGDSVYRSIERREMGDGLRITDNMEGLLTHGLGGKRATFLCNLRAEPTTEYVEKKTIHDQQPYTSGHWTIVHNGTVANDKSLRHEYGLCSPRVPTDIDSAAIAEMFSGTLGQDYTAAGFAAACRLLQGSFAILGTTPDRPYRMAVACNYRPIWYIETDLGVFFASSADYFPTDTAPKMIDPYTANVFEYYDDGRLMISGRTLYGSMKAPMSKVLAVCSGGLDSVVAATYMKDMGADVTLMHFLYGSRAEAKELDRIHRIAAHLEMPLVVKHMLDVWDKEDSNLLNPDSKVAGGEEGAEFAHEWVPARNLMMLAMATAYAEAKGYDVIMLGNNLEEAGAYPDNEPEFIRKFNALLPFAVGDGKRLSVVMPVGNMMKHEIVALGLRLGAPLHLTWSCYKNGEQHCGTCGPCYMRRTAFQINKQPEVIEYEDERKEA